MPDPVFPRFAEVARRVRETARLMVGVPDYDAYVRHVLAKHPGRVPMTYAEFFRERQEARFAAGRNGKCC